MMKHRKSHKKSRLGCAQCKQRRVKCDEQSPTCGNCSKKGRECSLSQPRPSTRSSDRTEKGLTLLHLDPRTTGDDWSLPSVELKLMHHFSVYTHKTLVQHPNDAEGAQEKLPMWGLAHPYLLDAIFSITSLHLAYSNVHPEDFQKYGKLGVLYQDRARAKLQSSLTNPDAEDCPMLFLASSLIALSAFVVPKVYARTSSLVATLIYLSRLFRGSGALETLSKQLVGEETWDLHFPSRKVEPIQSASPVHPEVRRVLDKVRAVINSNGDSSSPNDIQMETEDRISLQNAYRDGLDSLERAFQTVNCRMSNVLSWPVKAGLNFITLLDSGDPICLLVTLCYGILLHTLNDIWWAEGWGQQLIEEITPPLLRSNPAWTEMISLTLNLTRKGIRLDGSPPVTTLGSRS